MTRPTLTDFIDSAMRRTRLNAVAVERSTGVPASWTRQLKAGRMGGNADADRLRKVASALALDEAELWTYLGRMDLVAALRQGMTVPSETAPDLATSIQALADEARAWRTADRDRIAKLESDLADLRATVRRLTQEALRTEESAGRAKRPVPQESAG